MLLAQREERGEVSPDVAPLDTQCDVLWRVRRSAAKAIKSEHLVRIERITHQLKPLVGVRFANSPVLRQSYEKPDYSCAPDLSGSLVQRGCHPSLQRLRNALPRRRHAGRVVPCSLTGATLRRDDRRLLDSANQIPQRCAKGRARSYASMWHQEAHPIR